MDTGIADGKKCGTGPVAAQGGSLLRTGELSSYGVEWSDCLNATPRGGMAYFGHFLRANGQFDELVEGCPLAYASNNAPAKRDVLGTAVAGIVNGAWRYAHLSHLKGDRLCAQMLGLGGFVSEDSVRRGFLKCTRQDWPAWDAWLARAELSSVLPLLGEPYVMDIDTSVKQVFGRQEGAETGYNPRRPGRPSQSLHAAFIGKLRMLFSVDVKGGKAHAARHMAERFWARVDALPPELRPALLRGDIGFGNEEYLAACELRGLPFLFKLKMSAKVKRLVLGLAQARGDGAGWQAAPGGWEVSESSLTLSGWSRERRVAVLRRPFVEGKSKPRDARGWLPGLGPDGTARKWEYAVLVCSRDLPAESLPKLYAERADCENVLDELKNQSGLAGFTTRDLRRCKLMARLAAVVSNWWNVFARLAEPREHMEPITSRPQLLHLVAVLVVHGGKKVLRVCSQHEDAPAVKRAFERMHAVFSAIDAIAGQLDRAAVWAVQLSVAFYAWLRGKVLKVPWMAEDAIHQLALRPATVPV